MHPRGRQARNYRAAQPARDRLEYLHGSCDIKQPQVRQRVKRRPLDRNMRQSLSSNLGNNSKEPGE